MHLVICFNLELSMVKSATNLPSWSSCRDAWSRKRLVNSCTNSLVLKMERKSFNVWWLTISLLAHKTLKVFKRAYLKMTKMIKETKLVPWESATEKLKRKLKKKSQSWRLSILRPAWQWLIFLWKSTGAGLCSKKGEKKLSNSLKANSKTTQTNNLC